MGGPMNDSNSGWHQESAQHPNPAEPGSDNVSAAAIDREKPASAHEHHVDATDATRRRGPGAFIRRQLASAIEWGSRHPLIGCVGCLGLALGLLGVIAAIGLFLGVAFTTEDDSPDALELPVNEAGTSLNEPDPSVEEYVAGIVEFDAERMLGSYDSEIRNAMSAQGQSVADFQTRLDQAKAAGGKIVSARQIASYRLNNGARYVFYIMSREGFPPSGGLEEIYFIFTVSPSGKILRVV